jgi:MoaA/NifB/PqqE/SkfB family radical SAM enzyme
MPEYKIHPKTFYIDPDARLKNMSCTVPFKHIEIHMSGQISACCHTWLPQWVGNIFDGTPEEIISNPKRIEIQEGMKEGNFDYCNDQCPQLTSFLTENSNHWDIINKSELETRLSKTAMHVGFSYDPSCNLQCPSCRDNLIYYDPFNPEDSKGQHVKNIHEKVKELIEVLLTQHPIVSLDITGSGDAFASPLYWNYLLELASKPIPNNLRLTLKTNGVLMTEQNLKEIEPLWPHITYIEVSVDAFTEETYKIVRKNGNFKKLKKNLIFLDQMIYEKRFPNLHNWQTNFIVQRDNYKELKEFVEWQLQYKSKPKIWTNLLAQWYHMSDEKFKGMAVWHEDHVNRNELIDILKDPVFKNSQIRLGNMGSLIS